MDVDLILENIFSEYKKKCIVQSKDTNGIERHLEDVRDQIEDKIRESMADFIGRPINERTRMMMVDQLNRSINQFIDTEIKIDSIEDNESDMIINMTYITVEIT